MTLLSSVTSPSLNCKQAEACGGCPLINEPKTRQREKKLTRFKEIFNEVLQVSSSALVKGFHPASSPQGYRNRIRLKISHRGELEYFNKEKSICCPVLLPSLSRALAHLRRLALDLKKDLLAISHLELRAPDLDNQASLYLCRKPNISEEQQVSSELLAALSPHFLTSLDTSSPPNQRYCIDDSTYGRVPLGAFMQVNFTVNKALVNEVCKEALARNVLSCADLYCGSGNFLLPLLRAGISGIGVELNESAIFAARQAATEQRLGGKWICADVPQWVTTYLQKQVPHFDMLLLDPPRAGLKGNTDWLAKLAPRHIAFCSCNMKTMARDLLQLIEIGYNIDSIQLFDMFEHTEHVETLVWLTRSSCYRPRETFLSTERNC